MGMQDNMHSVKTQHINCWFFIYFV